MTLIEDLIADLDRDKIVQFAEFYQQTVRNAIESDAAVRVVPGAIAVSEAEADLVIEWAAAALLTGGVVVSALYLQGFGHEVPTDVGGMPATLSPAMKGPGPSSKPRRSFG